MTLGWGIHWPILEKIFLICFFNIFIWNLLASYRLSLLPAGRSALLGYTMPMWAVFLSVWILKEPFNFRIVLGLLLGTLSIFILMSESILQWLHHNNQFSLLIGGLLMIVAAWCWALGTNLIKLWALPIHSIVMTGWLLLTACWCFIFVIITHPPNWRVQQYLAIKRDSRLA